MTVSFGSLRRAAVVAPFAIYTSLAISAAYAGPLPELSTNGTITNKPALSPNSRLPSFLDYSGGNDTTRYEISPNYSDKLGWSLRGSLGSYVTNDLAVGLIAEYGRDKREYLANAGVQLNKELSFIGTVGMLDERQEYVAGDGKQTVQQMEYGASLKGAYSIGFLHGFELNGYIADANTKSDTIETGKLYGAQLLTNVFLTDTTHLKFGGGYEWLRWDGGEEDNHFSFRADGTQEISDKLSLNANVKLGASEYVYGGGLIYSLGNGTNTNTLALNYDYIEGKNGVLSDQRVELVWTMGLGVGPNAQSTMQRGTVSKNLRQSNEPVDAPVNSLLADVMKRPEFLPKQVLARAMVKGSDALMTCKEPTLDIPVNFLTTGDYIVQFFSDTTSLTFSFYKNGKPLSTVPSVKVISTPIPFPPFTEVFTQYNFGTNVSADDELIIVNNGLCMSSKNF